MPKIISRPPGRLILKAASPVDSASCSRLSSGSSRLSAKPKAHLASTGRSKNDGCSLSSSPEISNPPSVRLRTKPFMATCQPCSAAKQARIRMCSVSSLRSRSSASADKMMFSLIAKCKGLEDAIYWARNSTSNATAHLKRSDSCCCSSAGHSAANYIPLTRAPLISVSFHRLRFCPQNFPEVLLKLLKPQADF